MTGLMHGHDMLLPPRGAGASGSGALLSLVVHGALVLALAWGVTWRIHQPQVLTAELWASVPQQASPPPAAEPVAPPVPRPAPAPTPPVVEKAVERPDAQIAIERAEKLKREQADRLRREQELRDKQAAQRAQADAARREQEQKAERAEDERLKKQREDNLRRMLGAAGAGSAPAATGTGSRDAAPSAGYAGRIKARIKPNIVFADDARGNPEAEVEVRCAPEGTIVGRRIVKSSGLKSWDDAVLRAIDRTERLPPDTDGRVPATLIIAFRPRE
ncbi:MAG: cell envelope integrity protein TolA [Aquabacterium sp.]